MTDAERDDVLAETLKVLQQIAADVTKLRQSVEMIESVTSQ